jgi:hypothetical protein
MKVTRSKYVKQGVRRGKIVIGEIPIGINLRKVHSKRALKLRQKGFDTFTEDQIQHPIHKNQFFWCPDQEIKSIGVQT